MDCRTCKHNSYLNVVKDWVSCSHPITLAKQPRPEPGDPAFVDFRTGDLHVAQLHNVPKCPTYEANIPTDGQ